MPLIHMRVSLAAPTFCTLFPPLVSSPNCTHKRSSLQHRPVTISAAAPQLKPQALLAHRRLIAISPHLAASVVAPLLTPLLLSPPHSPHLSSLLPRLRPSLVLSLLSLLSPPISPLSRPSPPLAHQKMFEANYSRKLSSLKHRLKMFEANYSRKLSSLKHRLVTISPDLAASAAAASALPSLPALLQGFLYWRWAFESPHEVKVLVRKMLGEENTPQGHLRLILVPIVYNAMALKENLRKVHPPSPACRSCMESSIH
ncbi:unnamed protein product [Closterium sp. NIES-65]|nr:unnamed protein product [Closterium sp. NIES-65]